MSNTQSKRSKPVGPVKSDKSDKSDKDSKKVKSAKAIKAVKAVKAVKTNKGVRGQVGGRLLGSGQPSHGLKTLVYTSSDIACQTMYDSRTFGGLAARYPDISDVRLSLYADLDPARPSVRIAPVQGKVWDACGALGEALGRGVAVKDIPSVSNTDHEINIHRALHPLFLREPGGIELTSLHRTIGHLQLWPGNATDFRRLIVLRLMTGDLVMVRLDRMDLLNMAATVLRALRILHRNGWLHLDIKPGNVFYLDGRASAAYPSKRRFCLGDYNLVQLSDVVMPYLRNGQPHEHGTPGFRSPLLLPGADRGGMREQYAMMEYVAAHTIPNWRPPSEGWDAFCAARSLEIGRRAKGAATATIGKVDLQSLAFTLLEVACNGAGVGGSFTSLLARYLRARNEAGVPAHSHAPAQAQRPATMPDARQTIGGASEPLAQLIRRLLFFGPDDFRDADDALAYLEPHLVRSSKSTRSKGGSKGQHPKSGRTVPVQAAAAPAAPAAQQVQQVQQVQ